MEAHHDSFLQYISILGCTCSLGFLLMTFIVIAVCWKQIRSARVTMLLHLCIAISASCILILVTGFVQWEEVDIKRFSLSSSAPQSVNVFTIQHHNIKRIGGRQEEYGHWPESGNICIFEYGLRPHKSGVTLWTRIFLNPKNKNLRIQKFPDTCGLSLTFP